MTDVLTREKRSDVMSKIRHKGNASTEGRFIRILKENHITGWRRNRKIFGHPDFVFYNHRVVIFLDGCFWHGCNLHCKMPSQNNEFWKNKLQKNKERDLLVSSTLTKKGWTVIRIWEHELLGKNSPEFLEALTKMLISDSTPF